MGDSSDAREEPGAPIAPGAIDPELIKLSRAPSRIGLVTSLGVVVLAIMFIVRLNSDRRFSGLETPRVVTPADVAAGKVDDDSFVSLQAEPMVSHVIRAARSAGGGLGLRVVPARGTNDKLWLVLNGNGWSAPALGAYTGRLRAFSELPFGGAVREYAAAHPRPLFATPAATRAGFAANKVTSISGETLSLVDSDRVAVDVVDPNVVTIIASINTVELADPKGGPKPVRATAETWAESLAKAGLSHGPAIPNSNNTVRFEVKATDAVATATRALETAKLFAVRIEPINRHYETTWGALKGSTAAGLNVGTATIPDAQLDLVGLYVAKGIPDDAYALIVDEKPEQYWYVLWITIGLAVIGLLFGWAFVRAVKRDLLRA